MTRITPISPEYEAWRHTYLLKFSSEYRAEHDGEDLPEPSAEDVRDEGREALRDWREER